MASFVTYTGLGMNATEREARHRAAEYVTGAISLSDLEMWLAPVVWALNETSDPQLRALVSSIELKIAEYTGGAWSQEQLKAFIQEIAVPISEHRVVRFAPQGRTRR